MKPRRSGWVLLPRGRRFHYLRSTGNGDYISLCGIHVTLSGGPMGNGFPRYDRDCLTCASRMMASKRLCVQVAQTID